MINEHYNYKHTRHATGALIDLPHTHDCSHVGYKLVSLFSFHCHATVQFAPGSVYKRNTAQPTLIPQQLALQPARHYQRISSKFADPTHLESARCLEWKDTFFFSCSLEPCTLRFMVHLMELKPGIEEKVVNVSCIEDEELQCCQWCMSIHCVSSNAHAGICCTDGCKKCTKRLIATYLYCCFISNGDAFVTFKGTRECHKWSVPLHAESFDACMHVHCCWGQC